jgi:protein-S-isoprenylcysteine O-methyltransferase Ste14
MVLRAVGTCAGEMTLQHTQLTDPGNLELLPSARGAASTLTAELKPEQRFYASLNPVVVGLDDSASSGVVNKLNEVFVDNRADEVGVHDFHRREPGAPRVDSTACLVLGGGRWGIGYPRPVAPTPTPPVSSLKLAVTALYLFLWPALILFLAGDWRWPEGWIFDGWFLAVCITTITWLYRKDPALLAERYRRPGSGGQSRRDTIIVYLLVLGFIGWIVLMPLDARRLHWTPPLPLGIKVVGGGLLTFSSVFLFRSFTDNPFLSPLVRVQTERAHHVVSTGVYGVVRHPMYLGAILMFVGAPVLTGAASALGVGGALSLLLAVRIVDEEKLLALELAGYDEYRRRVRYRLVPFVW